jgi:outer membrane protein
MKKIQFECLLFAFTVFGTPTLLNATSLLEVYQQALQNDPLIQEVESRRLAALETLPQARSSLLPQINASGSWATSRESSEGRQIFDSTLNTFRPVSSKLKSDTTIWNVELRQTIFRWDQIVTLKQADKRIAKAEANREAAHQDLIIRVASRYFDVLSTEDLLTSIHADRLAIARQLAQAKQRFKVGFIAITDVQESQAAYDQTVASEIQAKRKLATSREFLREITGEYISTLSAPGDDFPLLSPNPNDERSWIDLAMGQNLTLISSRLDEKIARDEISFRRNGYYPSIDLVANTGGTDARTELNVNNSPFFPANSNRGYDSISLQITLPLFSGGRTSSKIREAVYLHRAMREQLQRVTRETERTTRDAYLGVLSEISRAKALKQAVASSRTALEATQAGFDMGTRTIVDVLNSQRSLYIAITNYYQSRYVYISNVLLLKQASGTLKIEDLEQINNWLEARMPPEKVIAKEKQKSG